MYPVSNAYKTAMQRAIQNTALSFTLNGVSYTEENILKGSFIITNQCSDTSDIKFGAVYSAQLKATLRNVSINRNTWKNKTIVPKFKIKLANDTWEEVPLGVFRISEAVWTTSGIKIEAYDAMTKFDKKCGINQSSGYLYDFLAVASQECGVPLAQTENELKALPNGSILFSYYSENDVETWRDLISWVAQTYGGFATINRSGQLEIRVYGNTSVDTLGMADRHKSCSFSDYITSYTGISYVDIASQTTKYFASEHDTGSTMNLGSNPFLQTKVQGKTACETLLTVMANMQYTPFKAISNTRDPAYDLGDCITFVNGLAGTSSLCCINRYNYILHSKYELLGYGADPDKAGAKSKNDKNLSGLLAEVSADKMAFYELRNVTHFTISDGVRKQILRLKLAAKNDTKVQIHISVNLGTDADAGKSKTIVTATYYIDNEEAVLHPEETYIDGNHVMHLMYILPMTANVISYFRLFLTATNGTITIDREGVWLYASGLGIVGDGTWDGEFDLEDTVTTFDTDRLLESKNVSDSVVVEFFTPVEISASDNSDEFNIVESITTFDSYTDVLRIRMDYVRFQRILEASEDIRVTEDGDYRYVEEEMV